VCYSREKALWLWGNTQCATMINTRILCTSRYIWWSKGHIDSEAIRSVSQWSILELCARLDILVDRKGHPRCLNHLKFSFFPARKGVFVSLAFFCPVIYWTVCTSRYMRWSKWHSRVRQSRELALLCIASESMCPFDHQIYLDVHRTRVLIIVIHCELAFQIWMKLQQPELSNLN